MPQCPMCECEFDEGTDACPDCGVPLAERTDEISAEVVDDDLPTDGLIVIEHTNDKMRVREIRELLEEGGIPCFISGEHFATNLTQIRAVLETKILIPREMKNDAEKLIGDYSRWQDKGRPTSHDTRGASSHRRVRT